jgi:YihY family inner membrane protein
MRKALGLAKALWTQVERDDVALLASALAFRFFLALFPFFLFLAALSSVVVWLLAIQDPADKMLELLGELPGGVAQALRGELQAVLDERRPGAISLGVVGTVWITATGVSALMQAMNHAYDVEETRPVWQRSLIAVTAALLAGPLLLGVFVLLMYGDFLGQQLAAALGLADVYGLTVRVGRWPVLLGTLLLVTAAVYRAAPNLSLRWSWVAPGALAFTAGWVGLTAVFSFYVDTFRAYGATYGTLASVAILLVWFYLSAVLLLLGAELNALLDRERRTGEPEKRGTRRARAKGSPMVDPHVPPEWSYNPSSWGQRLPIVGLALVGFGIATYLALFQVGIVPDVWEPFFGAGSQTILTSSVSRVLPVPDAALGAFGYLLDAVTGVIGGRRRWRTIPWIVILFGLAVGPLGAVSILLVILQPVLFDAWCTLCLASAAISVVMIGPAMDEFLASLQALKRARARGESVWRFFWGLDGADATDGTPDHGTHANTARGARAAERLDPRADGRIQDAAGD